jgi:predicted amidohydrolase
MSAQLLRQIRVINPLSNGDQMNDVLLIDGTIGAIAPTSIPILIPQQL